MNLYLRLAWRNIWRHRRRTLIVILSIGLSMSIMMLYDGVINGFETAIYSNAVKVLGGNIQVHAQGYSTKTNKNPLLPLTNDQKILEAARSLPDVTSASRRINTGGIITSRKGAFQVTITGIEPEVEQPLSVIAANIKSGRNLTSSDEDSILIGKGLADLLDAKVGDRFNLAGTSVNKQIVRRTMTVVGIYDVGLADIEKRTLFVSLAEAGYLYGLNDQPTEIAISLKSLGQEPAVIGRLESLVPGYEYGSWETNFPDMQNAIQGKSGIMDIFGVIILVIAGIGILNMLLMAVFERTREIGILGALGLKPRQISLLFVLEGFMMGVVGMVAGVLLGMAGNSLLAMVGIDYSSFTGVTEYTALISGRIYPTLGLEKLPMRLITVLIIAVLSSLYPAREAALHEPAKALHAV